MSIMLILSLELLDCAGELYKYVTQEKIRFIK